MGTRPPRDGREQVHATCESLRELADAYLPVLRYHDDERYFPVRAESWLTHTTSAPWEVSDVHPDDVPVDPWRRGTTLMSWNEGNIKTVAGPPNRADRPLRISSEGGDDAIGKHTGADAKETFLNVAGWNPLGGRTSGDPDYLYDLFSELSAAMNPRMAWTRPEQRSNLPHLWVPQPPNPTTYVEAAWAGRAARLSNEHKLGDFTEFAEGELDLMTLTYHYLYPCRGPLGDETSPRRLEGQWEAITIFFRARVDQEEIGTVEFPELFFSEPPLAVVVSRGLHRHGGTPAQEHKNLLTPWEDVETVVPATTRPVVYVAKGTHRHYFKPEPDTRWDPQKPQPGPAGGPGDIEEEQGDAVPGFEPWAAGAIAAAAAIPVIGPLLALILFLILLILWLASISHESSGDPVPSGPQPDSAPGDGAQAGGGEGDAGQGSPAVPGSGDSVTGTNAGSPTGRDIVSFDIRLVDSIHRQDGPTDFPTTQRCEYPHWWEYSGGWGVRVRPGLAQNWEDGMRRVDEHGRSWEYWNTLRFWLVRHGGSPGT